MAKGKVTSVVSRSFEHHSSDTTIWLDSPQFRGLILWGWSEATHHSSPSANLTRSLAARRLFRVLPSHAGSHIQTTMSSLGFKSSPYGTAVSVINHHTG
ncbi:hypothetical protein TNCV_938511 [Trichonephila clavipes]|nr:hypothetical protein TNCV_938511 [Trichonephila clavipes]